MTGQLIAVQPSLIKRSRSHFLYFEWSVEVILGVNGYIWVGKPRKAPDQQDLDAIYSSKLEPVSETERVAIARTRNCILALNSALVLIDEESIRQAFHISSSWDPTSILNQECIECIKTSIL